MFLSFVVPFLVHMFNEKAPFLTKETSTVKCETLVEKLLKTNVANY